MSRYDMLANVALACVCVVVTYSLANDYYASQEPLAAEGGTDNFVAPPVPTPTSIPGPQSLRPLVGKCIYVLNPDSPVKYEICGFRSVRQFMLAHNQVFNTGRWTGKWVTKEEGGKTKYVGMKYENGDSCPNIGPRSTLVEFKCDPAATTPKLVSLREGPKPCEYGITLGIAQWCAEGVDIVH